MVKVGDKVQIKDRAPDVTNGKRATKGRLYGEGGPLWAKVVAIVEDWDTGGIAGLPRKVTKVRCVGYDGKTVVWQVRPEDIAGQVSSKPAKKSPPEPKKKEPEPKKKPKKIKALVKEEHNEKNIKTVKLGPSNGPYAPEKDSSRWDIGAKSKGRVIQTGKGLKDAPKTAKNTDSMLDYNANQQTPRYVQVTTIWPDTKRGRMPKNMKQLGKIYQAKYKTSWETKGRKREMLNRDPTKIQNSYGFPKHIGKQQSMLPDVYDYQIIPNDKRYKKSETLGKRLMRARAALGIQVHGDNKTAKSVKYFMYNRFKVPDTNLAHNRSFTHVFFTRPDLYIMSGENTPSNQVRNHTDTAVLWLREPELFKLLCDGFRIHDNNNFNMLLSNQISSLSLEDEQLDVVDSPSSWTGHKMKYGEQYTGREGGTISCTFDETSNYAILNLIKLWMTYIDNVSRGAWSPYYGKNNKMRGNYCHVATRSIDYGASMYIIRVGEDGESIKFWSKYYGIFPVSSGASALSYSTGLANVIEVPRPTINFAYSYKRDMSPISLLEFNHNSGVIDEEKWQPAYQKYFKKENAAHVVRPYVGCPYIEIDRGITNMDLDSVANGKSTQIRLKFKKDHNKARTDKKLFYSNH